MAAASSDEAANSHKKKTDPACGGSRPIHRLRNVYERMKSWFRRPKLPPGSRSQSFGSGCMSNSITAPF